MINQKYLKSVKEMRLTVSASHVEMLQRIKMYHKSLGNNMTFPEILCNLIEKEYNRLKKEKDESKDERNI